MLLKAVGQPLRTVLLKGYRIAAGKCPQAFFWPASGKFLKGIGKPLGNAQIPESSQ
jgi:hypothetical protein